MDRVRTTIQTPRCDRGAAFERVAEDCEQLLGPEIELHALEVAADRDVVLRCKYRLGKADWVSEGQGDTVIEAHAALRDALVLDRLRLGVRALYKENRA